MKKCINLFKNNKNTKSCQENYIHVLGLDFYCVKHGSKKYK